MLIVRDSQVKKLFYKEQEIDKILDWKGNVVFEKESAQAMTNDIKFTTNSRVGTVYHKVYYTDSTSDTIKTTEPNKLYVLPIPTDKTVQQLETYDYYLDEVAVSCKIKLSKDFITQPPKTIRLLDCDATSSTSLTSLFTGSTVIETIEMRGLNVSNITDMYRMFYNCSATIIDIANWDTSSATNFKNVFDSCKNVASLDLSSWDTSNATTMSEMFQYCSSLVTLDLSTFNTSKVRDFSYMFWGCSSLASLDLSGWDMSRVVLQNPTMFYKCGNLTTIKMIGCSKGTIDKMKGALSNANMLSQVTIVTE